MQHRRDHNPAVAGGDGALESDADRADDGGGGAEPALYLVINNQLLFNII